MLTIILPIVLYDYATLSLIPREEHGSIIFENEALRKIFGTDRNEERKDWRKLHSEKIL
jgi:hypothetical protein